jgi:K(+)-stimulated pyrophosphate-energized sodium pump
MKLSRLAGVGALLTPVLALASEANLKLPDLASQVFLGVNGRMLLMSGIAVAILGLVFGFMQYSQLRALSRLDGCR